MGIIHTVPGAASPTPIVLPVPQPLPQPTVTPLVRRARPDDLPAILAIQAQCYFAIVPESALSMGAKLAAAPESCFVAEADGQLLAYLLALPWTHQAPPPLDAPACLPPRHPDTLYLHDLAVAPAARGRGAAQILVGAFLDFLGRSGLPRASLIAIQSSVPFWMGFGFRPVATTAEIADKLVGYGPDAHYMSRPAVL